MCERHLSFVGVILLGLLLRLDAWVVFISVYVACLVHWGFGPCDHSTGMNGFTVGLLL